MNLSLTAVGILMNAYFFKDWNELYENFASRGVQTLTYYSQPNKLHGENIGYLLMQEDGLELYGTLGFIKSLASTASPRPYRGWLVRNGTAMTPVRMAALARIPVAKIERALAFFSTPPMDWILVDTWPDDGTPPPSHAQAIAAAHGEPLKEAMAIYRLGIGKNVRLSTDRRSTEEDLGSGLERERGPSAGEVQASRTRAGALLSQIRELEGRKASLSQEERGDLRKKRRELSELQKKQAAGDFTAERSVA